MARVESLKKDTGLFTRRGQLVQVLGVGRTVDLRLVSKADKLTEENLKRQGASCGLKITKPERGTFQLTGERVGESKLQFFHKSPRGAEGLRMEIHVVRTRKVSLNLWYLCHGRNDTSLTPPASTSGVVQRLNQIYLPQAAIQFTAGKVINTGSLPKSSSTRKLLDGIDFTTHEQSKEQESKIWRDLKKARDEQCPQKVGQKQIDVFFIGKWGAHDKVCVPGAKKCDSKDTAGTAGAFLGDNVTVIEQSESTELHLELLAHELGHNLGATHDLQDSNTLMDHTLERNSTRMSWKTAEQICGLR